MVLVDSGVTSCRQAEILAKSGGALAFRNLGQDSGCLEVIAGSHQHGILPFVDGAIPLEGLPPGIHCKSAAYCSIRSILASWLDPMFLMIPKRLLSFRITQPGHLAGSRVPCVLPAFGACLLTQMTAHRSYDNNSGGRCRW